MAKQFAVFNNLQSLHKVMQTVVDLHC